MHCPTRDEVLASTLSLLPRGRAWRNNEGGPEVGSVLYAFWQSLAAGLHFFVERICALRLEMFCATMSETREQWLAEYGLPDACDPFPDLCAKVAALGGSTCPYFVAAAARAGWSIDCEDEVARCGAEFGCDEFGCTEFGGVIPTVRLIITVDLSESPAYQGAYEGRPFFGCMQFGMSLACDADIGPLQCLLDRIAPAHVEIVYNTIVPPIYIMADSETHIEDETGALLVARVPL